MNADDWDEVRALYLQLERGQGLVLSDEVRGLCQRAAPGLGLSEEDARNSLLTQAGAEAFVREVLRRIFEGSRRLSQALVEADRRQKAGDLAGAREVLRDVLSVEVVPHYGNVAERTLAAMDDPEV